MAGVHPPPQPCNRVLGCAAPPVLRLLLLQPAFCIPQEVQDAAPPGRASSSPRPLLSRGSSPAGRAKNRRRRSCTGARRAPCPPPRRGDASQEAKCHDRIHPRCPACREHRGFPGCYHLGKRRLGLRCCRGAGGKRGLPCPRCPVGGIPTGGIAATGATARPGGKRGVRGGGMGKLRFLVSRRQRKRAGAAACVLDLSPESRRGRLLSRSVTAIPKPGPVGESRVAQQVFIPVTGAEGMCPWQGGTDVGTPLPALAAVVFGHRAEGRWGIAVLLCRWWGARVTRGLAVPLPACPSRPVAVFRAGSSFPCPLYQGPARGDRGRCHTGGFEGVPCCGAIRFSPVSSFSPPFLPPAELPCHPCLSPLACSPRLPAQFFPW